MVSVWGRAGWSGWSGAVLEVKKATLRATRTADLSTEIRNQRLLIEARALSDIGRHELALEVITNVPDREAIRLLAEGRVSVHDRYVRIEGRAAVGDECLISPPLPHGPHRA